MLIMWHSNVVDEKQNRRYLENLDFYDFKKNISNLRILINGVDKTRDVEYVQRKFSKINVKFLGNPTIYNYNLQNIVLKEDENVFNNPIVKAKMEYFYNEALVASLKFDDSEKNILQNYYDKITNINKELVLASYLLNQPVVTKSFNLSGLIYPFGLNVSQKKAVENAFGSNISIIEGPPGTGKTQTILSIIANALLNNLSVAVVSNNNSAIKNVEDKLKKYELDFLTAFLGSKQNKEKFIAEQKQYPDLSSWKQVAPNDLEKDIASGIAEIDAILALQNEIAVFVQLESDYQLEKKHFDNQYAQEQFNQKLCNALAGFPSKKVLRIWAYCSNRNKEKLSCVDMIFFLWNMGLKYFRLSNKNLFTEIVSIQRVFYDTKLKEIKQKTAELNEKIQSFNFEKKLKEICEQSLKLLKHKIFLRFNNKERQKFTVSSTYSLSNDFIKEYPIVFSTLYSVKNLCNNGFAFDYLIVDEASQADLLTGALGMSCAKNIVVVGDLMQLPNVITDEVKKKSHEIWKKYDFEEAYNFSEHSLLSSLTTLYPDAPRVLLKEHYRCHPKIINFCNKKFYDDKLVVMTAANDEKDILKAIEAVKGNYAKGHVNKRHIDIIKEEIMPFIDNNCSVGIITPYRDQVNELRKSFDSRIEIDTIHKFQGREKDVIIFTTVDNNITDFADDGNLINVAVSRAVKNFYLVYSNNKQTAKSNIIDLVNYISYNNFTVVSSKVYSIFDLLYKQYTEERIKILSKYEIFSWVPSEKLAYICIMGILKENNIQSLSLVMHMPLKSFIKSSENLSEAEILFISRDSHVDFLLYDKMNKLPRLAIEVDGYAYHNNPKQKARDLLKEHILSKAGITLVRLSTKGSMERERIKCEIDKVLGE